MAEKTFVVSGIHCEGCESRIEDGLGRLPGVQKVRADHRDQVITVRYVAARLGEAELVEQLARLGYPPVAGGG